MTPEAFADALAWQLRLQGRPYDRAALKAFVADVWRVAEDDPDPARWAAEFAAQAAGVSA